jgi:hypothetical protein
MATLNNPRSDVIASIIEPDPKSTLALVYAALLEIVGFRTTSSQCQNGFVAGLIGAPGRPKWQKDAGGGGF